MARAPDVTVLGAGIGGLAAAIACRLTGRTVRLVEQAPALTEVGAGLQIAPNGGRVLDALGVSPKALASDAVHLIDGPTGRPVIRMPVGPGFRMIHRADLIEALAARADGLGVDVMLGTTVEALGQTGVTLTDGRHIPTGRVIGADGARGPSRRFVAPDHEARFTGQVAWRCTVPVPSWPGEAQVHMGAGRHLVCYPLRDGTTLNIVAVEERSAWTAGGWSQRDDPAALRRAFADFAPEIRALLERVEEVHLWGLMDHGATGTWTRGHCTLIGDAAHPTLPFLAQGANLALEDAWTLAACLDDPQGWEAARQPRVTRALAAAAGNATNYHLGGARRIVGHAALRLLGRLVPGFLIRRYDWLYAYDSTA